MPVLKWLTESFDSVLLSGLRVTAACTLLIGMVVRTRRWPRLAPGQWYTLLACGALITALTPLATAACALLGERPNLGRLVAVAAVLCGVAVGVL